MPLTLSHPVNLTTPKFVHNTVLPYGSGQITFEMDSKAAPTTILSIPNEVLADIVLLSIPEEKSPSLNEAPLNISHVCRSLRQLTLNTPLLWNHLSIQITSSKSDCQQMQLLKHWVERSGSAPLDYSILWTSLSGPETFKKIATILTPTMDRWRSIALLVDPASSNFKFIAGLYTHHEAIAMPALEIFKINAEENLLFRRIDLSGSTRLKTLALSNIPRLQWHEIAPTINSEYLTDLSVSLSGPTYIRDYICLMDVLARCPQLTRLSIPGFGFWDKEAETDPISILNEVSFITMEHLTLLDICNGDWSCSIIRKLVAPSLIRSTIELNSMNSLEIMKLIQRSNRQLGVLVYPNQRQEQAHE